MSEINVNSQLTFRELVNRTAPGDKDMAEIAEVMAEKNELLLDIPWFECNQLVSEKFPRRTGLPTGTWRQAYQGVARKASTTQPVVVPVALLEAGSEIDEDIVDNAPNPKEFRRSEDIAFTEGLAQQVADAFIESTQAGSPEKFDGLQIHLNALSQTNVIDGGNAGGTSIYAVNWGRRRTYGIYPAAAANRGPLGLTIKDKGREKVFDGSDNPFYAFVTQFKWWCGLCVRDELTICRYANINPTQGGSNSFDEDKLITLLNRCRMAPATTRIYCNQEIKTQMQIRAKDKGNIQWLPSNGLSGIPVVGFLGRPVRQLDAIKTDEPTVS